MIAIDTNILVYAHRSDSIFHSEAAAVVRRVAEGNEPWAIPWPCIHEFLAVATNPRIYKPPTPVEKAIAQVEMWMAAPTLRLIGESGSYWPAVKAMVLKGQIVGAQVHDARVAAICKSHGVRALWSVDRDFSRMDGCPVTNPLVAGITSRRH